MERNRPQRPWSADVAEARVRADAARALIDHADAGADGTVELAVAAWRLCDQAETIIRRARRAMFGSVRS